MLWSHTYETSLHRQLNVYLNVYSSLLCLSVSFLNVYIVRIMALFPTQAFMQILDQQTDDTTFQASDENLCYFVTKLNNVYNLQMAG